MTTLSTQGLLLLLGAVSAGLVVFYGYVLRREGRQDQRLNPWQITTLWLLRICVAVLALVALARPAVRHVRTEERLPVLPMVVDESLSMAFPDSRDNPLVQANPAHRRTRYDTAQTAVQKLQDKLSRTHRVRVYTFSDSLKLLRELPHRPTDKAPLTREEIFAAHPQPSGEHSNIGDALADVLRDLAGEKVSGLVLLSDGRQTGGLDRTMAAEQAASARLPIHTVVLGTEYPLRDLRIDEVMVGAEASLGDVLTFHVKITNQISSPLATELTLEEKDADPHPNPSPKGRGEKTPSPSGKSELPPSPPGRGEGVRVRRPVTLVRGQQVVPIAMIPETEGLRKFRLSLPPQPDEVNYDNNVAEVTIKVIKRTLKVLLIAGQPSREYYYLVPALLRDPIIDLSCYLQAADVDYVQQGNSVIERLPATVKDWSRYDVCILFDVDPNGITTQQVAGLENMVSKGGGLMVLAGRNHGLAKLVQVHAARIRGMLPVEIDKNRHLDHDRVYDKPYKVERTIKGKSHPILLAAADPKTNEDTWATFGRLDFFWHHPIQGVKSKAISLIERTGGGSDPACLMAIHRYDEGAVFFSALDSLWLWRYPGESYDYDRLWTRVIRYLGEARLLGTQQQVALATDRRSYSPGEDVQIALQILDPALLAQLSGQPVYAGVGGSDKDQYMVRLALDPGGEPVYRGAYRARQLGSMVVQARQAAPEADSEAKPLFDVKHGFQVKMQSLEDVDTSADLKAMAELAAKTRGKYFDYHTMGDLDSLINAIPTDPQVLSETIVEEVWDGAAFLILFLVLVSSELSLRKWWGLL